MDPTQLRNLDLPKWPAMIVRGSPVSIEQAKEIIRRTDDFFKLMGGGNNHDFEKIVRKAVKMPSNWRDGKTETMANLQTNWDAEIKWREQWGIINTIYVDNDWIASSYICGSHGWCSPNGIIENNLNVGKWPSVEDIENDWKQLAGAFPFLELGVTLMNKEYCETEASPVVSMLVKNGDVTLVDPNEIDVISLYGNWPPQGEYLPDYLAIINQPCGVPMDWIDEWAKTAKELIK